MFIDVFLFHENRSALPRADDFYSCKEDAVPVLHDTAIHLSFTRTFDNPSIDLLSNIGEESIEILKVLHCLSQIYSNNISNSVKLNNNR